MIKLNVTLYLAGGLAGDVVASGADGGWLNDGAASVNVQALQVRRDGQVDPVQVFGRSS